MADVPGSPGAAGILYHWYGKAYLDFWARSLEQYKRNVDAFFQLYTGRKR